VRADESEDKYLSRRPGKRHESRTFVAIAVARGETVKVYVKRHNYVSFAATGNKFRRFAREIARVKGTTERGRDG